MQCNKADKIKTDTVINCYMLAKGHMHWSTSRVV